MFDVWPGHLLKSLIGDLESFSQIESQSLRSIREDVEGDLGPLPLHVRDESLQEGGCLNLRKTV